MDEEPGKLMGLTLDQKTIDILVANIIPTSKYFEARFNHLQYQVDELKAGQKNLLDVMDKRFEQVDNRFAEMKSDMDKRFGQVDNRFAEMKSDMDKRFGQVDNRFTEMKSDMDKRFSEMQSDMDKRFSEMQNNMDTRFAEVDRRFAQVDQRFEQVDKHFLQIEDKLDKILERIDRRIDEGLRENRAQSMRMFTFAMTFSAISMIGLVGKMLKLF